MGDHGRQCAQDEDGPPGQDLGLICSPSARSCNLKRETGAHRGRSFHTSWDAALPLAAPGATLNHRPSIWALRAGWRHRGGGAEARGAEQEQLQREGAGVTCPFRATYFRITL